MANTLTIGIPTYKRPKGLRALLESIREVKAPDDVFVHIVVADNEGLNGSADLVVKQMMDERFPFSIVCLPVVERGISHARNALMDFAFGNATSKWLIMVDDDEIVSKDWIIEFLKIQQATLADVVGGRVDPRLESKKPWWFDSASIYYANDNRSTGPVAEIDGTTNILFNETVYKCFGKQRFDPFYALVGGGDKEFLTRLANEGAKFAYSREAYTEEIFGPERLSINWAVKRTFRIGAAGSRIILKHSSPAIVTKEIVKIAVAVFFSLALMPLFLLFSRNKFAKLFFLFVRQLGKVSGFFGFQVREYKRTYGK